MTRAEWLKARGWTEEIGADGVPTGSMFDPLPGDNETSRSFEGAATVQRARDAAEERKAWVQFAAGCLAQGGDEQPYTVTDAANVSDRMLVEYRARFPSFEDLVKVDIAYDEAPTP